MSAELTPPHCPHCDAPMDGIGLFNWLAGPWMIMAAYCAACKKALHFATVPAQIVQTSGEGETENPTWDPNRPRRPRIVS